MITLSQYVGIHKDSPDWTAERKSNAVELLSRVNALLGHLGRQGTPMQINPVTGSLVSGQTFGGFRPQSCPQGAPTSSHKIGQGVDLFDPRENLDNAITTDLLIEFGLYREAPSATKGWTHLTTRPPKSGKRTFLP